MARRPSKPEDPVPGPGPWVVSFNDCMTNLLCFFVMLVSFSSFDAKARCRVQGAFRGMALDSVFPGQVMLVDSLMPPPDWALDRTERGAEVPSDRDPASILRPRRPPLVPQADVYKDRKDLYVPMSQLFWARGTLLTPQGRSCLDMVGALLEKLPSRVIVSAYEPGADDLDGPAAPPRLERCRAIVEYLAAQRRLAPDVFRISAANVPRPGRADPAPFVRITLLSREGLP